jgi:Cu/Ag efflux pump CusA
MSRVPWQQILSFTPADLVKLLLSAAVIVIVNKVQLFSDRLSALLIALPLTSLVAMIWMHQGGQSGPRCLPIAC